MLKNCPDVNYGSGDGECLAAAFMRCFKIASFTCVTVKALFSLSALSNNF